MKFITVDANEACARVAYLFSDISVIYPITPASPMAEYIDKVSSTEKNLFGAKVNVVQMQSEAGAIGAMHGALLTGSLTSTFTASQGLLLMLPNMYKIAGEMLPGVIHVAARSLATHALSIMGDHQDIYATANTGFITIASSSVQDASILAGVSHLSAIKLSLPFMHFFDGFRTSHEINKIKALEIADYQKLLDVSALDKFRKSALNPKIPQIQGMAQGDDVYFQNTEARSFYYKDVYKTVKEYMDLSNEITGFNYQPFNYYGSSSAKHIIVAMGSVTTTILEVVNDLVDKGYEIGLVVVHLFRPFNQEAFNSVIPKTVSSIAVLDRSKNMTGDCELYQVVKNSVNSKTKVYGGRYGLSSKNTTINQIKSVFDYLQENKLFHDFVIGIVDDVSNLSLTIDDNYQISKTELEMKIYGYGSDGMIGSSKNIIKLIGDNTKLYPQGYFQYDSKKSGGLTISHLRFGKKVINSSYYVENPHIVVVSKDNYLNKYATLKNIRPNGIFILNTQMTKDDIIEKLPYEIISILKDRNIKFYIIDALKVSQKCGLGNKIGIVLESAIYNITNLYDSKLAMELMRKYAFKRFSIKGEDVVQKNYNAIEQASKYIYNIDTSQLLLKSFKNSEIKDNYSLMVSGEGNQIPTSAFLESANGRVKGGTSHLEKRKISNIVPLYTKENCIECNQCSMVCPHGVIKPYILTKEEVSDAALEDKVIKLVPSREELYYTLGISINDCTGCSHCVKTCPGKAGVKALEMVDIKDSNISQAEADYLDKLPVKRLDLPRNNRNTQFKKSSFLYSGACSGCGETPYLKLMTQVVDKNLMVANATGCSSIYGASNPSFPYTISWANSLFEDNSEFGYGMYLTYSNNRNNLVINVKEQYEKYTHHNQKLLSKWLDNLEDENICLEVYENLDYENLDENIVNLKEYFQKRTIFIVGGDGFAYDIGFSGLDHVLSTDANINVLVLDTQTYSNTGGQVSKATHKGAVGLFATSGKVYKHKNLAKMMMGYNHVYVATVNLNYNKEQCYKAYREAIEYNGPSLIIAYCPCISHGIEGGMNNACQNAVMATKSGYFPIFRYHPIEKKFYLDSKKDTDFSLFKDFLMSQNRYKSLFLTNEKEADKLLQESINNSKEEYNQYLCLSEGEK